MIKNTRLTFGMPELLVLSSVWVYSNAFTFSMILLTLGLIGKFFAFALEAQAKKTVAENGEKTVKTIADTLTNAIALGNLGGKTKNGKFH